MDFVSALEESGGPNFRCSFAKSACCLRLTAILARVSVAPAYPLFNPTSIPT
jgi:hypothetical protein